MNGTMTMVRPARRLLRAVPIAAIAAASMVSSAQAARKEAAYMDDRSTPQAVIESLYNAINHHEYARAYSYWGEDSDVGTFDKFQAGYSQTIRTRLYIGDVASEGAAGSVYYTVPVSVRTVNKDGTTVVFAGCYTLRLAEPTIQGVPYKPMHIVKGKLLRAKGRTSQAVPNNCDS